MLSVADGLSLSRVLILPVLLWAVIGGRPRLAIVLFAFAVASDVLDGIVARRQRLDGARGALLDHGADAVFVCATSLLWATLGLLPLLLPVLILLAFLQYAIDSRASASTPLRPSRLGRINGIAYYVASGAALGVYALPALAALGDTVFAFGWLLVASTVGSMATRAAYSRRHARS